MAFALISAQNDPYKTRKPASAPLEPAELNFNFAGVYVAGGLPLFETFVRSSLSNRQVECVCTVPIGACGAYRPVYDRVNDTLMLFTGATEVTPGTNISLVEFSLIVFVI